jgi:Na+/H+ antiporter NhaD/arsenite permease-like protein
MEDKIMIKIIFIVLVIFILLFLFFVYSKKAKEISRSIEKRKKLIRKQKYLIIFFFIMAVLCFLYFFLLHRVVGLVCFLFNLFMVGLFSLDIFFNKSYIKKEEQEQEQ